MCLTPNWSPIRSRHSSLWVGKWLPVKTFTVQRDGTYGLGGVMKKLLVFLALVASTLSFARVACPNGQIVEGQVCTQCPNGRYVGGTVCVLTPNGAYIGGHAPVNPNPRTTPNRNQVDSTPFNNQLQSPLELEPPNAVHGRPRPRELPPQNQMPRLPDMGNAMERNPPGYPVHPAPPAVIPSVPGYGNNATGNGRVVQCPDGTYVTGRYCVMTPNGTYVGR